jgi:hypoxanthine phosphoribosyltransferase
MSAPRDLTQAAPSTSEHTIWCREERFRRYLDAATIQARTREIGAAISQDYDDTTPILIGVLNGAFMFIADLMRAIDIDCEIDFMKLSSYGAAKVSSGDVTELKKIDANLEGRHVIIVEDIVDTGLSMEFILQRMALHDPASVRVATLLHKPDSTEVDLELDYVGFEIPNLFVIGYGLDYGQIARNLPDLYILDEASSDA